MTNLGRAQDFELPPPPSYAERLVQHVHLFRELETGEGVDDPAVLHDEEAVGDGRGEAEILLDEQDREALALEFGDRAADLLDYDWGEPLGRLVEHQEPRAGPEDSGDRQ